MVKDGGRLPGPSLHSPTIAMNNAPFNVKRCFVFGYLAPVNTKNLDAGMTHRLLLRNFLLPTES
jgi:hypothetical protein